MRGGELLSTHLHTRGGNLLWAGRWPSAGAWKALPPGSNVDLHMNTSVAAVQVMMEYLITQARPFHGRQRPHMHEAQARVKAFSPPNDLAYVLVTADGVTLRKKGHGADAEEARGQNFLEVARRKLPLSDKVTSHGYQLMYGALLTPAAQRAVRKFLEIGLGCDMRYGPGASVRLWAELLPRAERWAAELDEACVESKRDLLQGVRVLTGDQANRTTLAQWISQTAGSFDMVVDDGGHHNHQVMASYGALWPHVNPGGVYVMEDIHVCRSVRYDGDAPGSDVPADFVQTIAARLLRGGAAAAPADTRRTRTPPPPDAGWVLCQQQACAFGKVMALARLARDGRRPHALNTPGREKG